MRAFRAGDGLTDSAALVALLALLVRLAVPAGWMPAGDRFGLVPCPAAAHVATMARGLAHRMHGKHQGSDTGDRACPFAAFACAVATPNLPAMPADPLPLVAFVFLPPPLVAAVGAGLVAPPPPPTGPPAAA